MSTEVAICNQALGWLGGNLITSLDDNTVEARLCKANYALLRDAVIEEGKWSFATKRIVLIPTASDPEWGYQYEFLLPSTVFVVVEVHDSALVYNGASDLDWRREEDKILCDATRIYTKCIVQIVNPKRFTRTFTQALAYRIAAELAVPLTESRAKEQAMEAKYDKRIALALAIDGQQGKRDRLRGQSLLRSR